jgi:hypothetical protein
MRPQQRRADGTEWFLPALKASALAFSAESSHHKNKWQRQLQI